MDVGWPLVRVARIAPHLLSQALNVRVTLPRELNYYGIFAGGRSGSQSTTARRKGVY